VETFHNSFALVWPLGFGKSCQASNAEVVAGDLFATSNPLTSQTEKNLLSPFSNIRAGEGGSRPTCAQGCQETGSARRLDPHAQTPGPCRPCREYFERLVHADSTPRDVRTKLRTTWAAAPDAVRRVRRAVHGHRRRGEQVLVGEVARLHSDSEGDTQSS